MHMTVNPSCLNQLRYHYQSSRSKLCKRCGAQVKLNGNDGAKLRKCAFPSAVYVGVGNIVAQGFRL